MLLNDKTLLLDLLTNFWLSIICLILFWELPKRVFPKTGYFSPQDWVLGNVTRLLCFLLFIILLLARIHIFNWLTITLIYSLFLGGWWIFFHIEKPRQHFSLIGQNLFAKFLDCLDQGLLNRDTFPNILKCVRKYIQKSRQKIVAYLVFLKTDQPKIILNILSLAIVFTIAIVIRWEYPLTQLRFGHSDSYQTLLLTQQIIAQDNYQVNYIPVYSALAAFLSILGSIHPMHTVRFLGPILGLLLVLSVGYCVKNLSKNSAAGFVSMYSLGAYLFTSNFDVPTNFPGWIRQFIVNITDNLNNSLVRQWAGNELELGAIFLLIYLGFSAFIFHRSYGKNAVINIICALAIITLAAPGLLILALIGGVGMLAGKRVSLIMVTIAWLLLAGLAAIPTNPFYSDSSFLLTLPIALSLLSGLLFICLSSLLSLILGKWSEIICIILIFSITLNFCLPQPPKLIYVEYEMAARKALEINSLFPRKTWMIVAPVEQLAEVYGTGWYEDLARFVEKYSTKVGQKKFNFDLEIPDLFVFVEKKPLVIFPEELQGISYAVLSDPSYRYYRSPAGRASLQFEALQMCEAYSRTHNNASIYYEDDQLRIYHFRLEKTS